MSGDEFVIGQGFLLAALLTTAMGTASPETPYEEGQVWEYRTRQQDHGSLLRIQKIENEPGLAQHGPIYHIGVIGVHFSGTGLSGELQHLPVSRETLNASVTRLSRSKAPFPDSRAGIEEWRAARGGVFTIPVAEIIAVAEATFRGAQLPAQSRS